MIIDDELINTIWFFFSGRRKKLGEISAAIGRVKLSSVSQQPHVNWNIQRHIPWFGFNNSSTYYYSYGKNNISSVVNVSDGGAVSLPHGWPLEKVWVFFFILTYFFFILFFHF